FGGDHFLGVSVGFGPGDAELLRGPQPEQPVAPCDRLEFELLVVGELLLEPFLALVERGHSCLAVCGTRRRPRGSLPRPPPRRGRRRSEPKNYIKFRRVVSAS